MLHQFLVSNRRKILSMVRSKTAGISEDRPTTVISEKGMPQFYAYLVQELRREAKGRPKRSEMAQGPRSTAAHGKELSRLGYTVSQVVHGYGVLCQAITELAQAAKAPISANEFSTLNLCLDKAIAAAVTEFTRETNLESVAATERMGFMVHELRNALTAAIIAHTLIKKGIVGIGSNTNALLERNFNRMRDLLDRSFTEVRMRNDKVVERRPVLLIKVAEEVEATASEQARLKGLKIIIDVDPRLQAIGDHNYLTSALSNLVQNALKFTKEGGRIWVRGWSTDKNIVLEVEDECGGLPDGKAEELFQPYTQKSSDRTGLGLGLTISRRAIALNGGTLAVHDLPGKGCIFHINLPRHKSSRAKRRPVRPGRRRRQRLGPRAGARFTAPPATARSGLVPAGR